MISVPKSARERLVMPQGQAPIRPGRAGLLEPPQVALEELAALAAEQHRGLVAMTTKLAKDPLQPGGPGR
jgi:hypothetical protein